MSPPLTTEEYNFNLNGIVKESFTSINHSVENVGVGSIVPQDEIVVVPKLERSVRLIDLLTPEDGKAKEKEDVIDLVSPIEGDEKNLKNKKTVK